MKRAEWLELAPEVQEALDSGTPIVVLESSVWAQGLPRPMNLEVALETCEAVRREGALPAIVAIGGGRARVGLSGSQLERLCGREGIQKVGVGDLAGALASGVEGATSVSSTLVLAERVGLEVFATGGVGGVHLNWNQRPDVSSDLGQLARTRCLTVCSGVKSVLDVFASVELIETLGIPLALYRTPVFPRFYAPGLPIGIGFRVDSPEEVARAHRLSLELLGRGLMVTQAVPAEHQVSTEDMLDWLREGMLQAERERRFGKELTPFLLDHLARASGGKTLEANRALLVANARLAARIAGALAALDSPEQLGAPIP